MRNFNVTENEIMPRSVILAEGLEEYIIKRMCAVAADNGLVRIHIDFRIGEAVSAISVFGIAAGFADVFCDDDGAGFAAGASCLQFIKTADLDHSAQRTTQIACFFPAVHVLAVSAEALQAHSVQQPFLCIAATVAG